MPNKKRHIKQYHFRAGLDDRNPMAKNTMTKPKGNQDYSIHIKDLFRYLGAYYGGKMLDNIEYNSISDTVIAFLSTISN